MTDWTAGYVANIGYTYGYYPELNPMRLQLAFLKAGLAVPEVGAACELGFGQGMSANLHASASATRWFGTDFNPAQAAFAQELATVSGSGAKLFDEAFADFCHRADLPDFDYIGLHGIWSWISDENRALIVDFIRRKLRAGGVLYISYNTQPGWAAMVPMRDLLTEHADVMAAPGHGLVPRIDAAIEFAEKLLATNPAYARANPQVTERIKGLKDQNRNYLAHEYFNRDWHPMSFARMADCLSAAKLNFACSANYVDHADSVNLTHEQRAFLQEIPDPMFSQTVRDFMLNRQFRADYWVKGARKLSRVHQLEALRKQRFILVQPRADVSLAMNTPLGEVRMQEAVYGSILDVLADHQPRTLEQIEQLVSQKNIKFTQVLEAVMMLVGSQALRAAQDETAIAQAKQHTSKLNAFLCDLARGNANIEYLASPVTGGGIHVPRFSQLFMLARNQGNSNPVDLAGYAWKILLVQGQRLVKDDKAIDDEAGNIAELTRYATEFTEKQLTILQALQVA